VAGTVTLEQDEIGLQEYFRERDLTDGLPIIVPTTERVERFLDASGYIGCRDQNIGQIAPLNDPITVEDVGINGLMAGARPMDLGILLAAVEAMQNPAFHLMAMQTTTNPAAPFVFVNGPVVKNVGLGTSNHALGPGRHPNGSIGRAVRFILHNLGGASDDVDRASLGQPAKYSCLLGEAEEQSPWEPYHVSRGYQRSRSVVTVAAVENIVNVVAVTDRHKPIAGPFLRQFGRLMQAIGTNIFFSNGSPVVIVTPGQARRLAEEGYDRRRLQEALFEGAKVPLAQMPYGNMPTARWTVVDESILPCPSPDDVRILVAGGSEGLHSVYLQSFWSCTASSAEIKEPELMDAQARGS
jgi:hypothetical protein